MNLRKTSTAALIALLGVFVLSAGSCESDKTEARKRDEAVAGQQLLQYQDAQPVPRFDYSQLRQNLIEIETAQVNSTATTSFMFLMGSAGTTGPLVHSCPSIGFPIPATYQLTNPEQKAGDGAVLSQLEANGVFTGDTTGTYVMCVGANGRPYAFYWEGFVATATGPAHWDNVKGEVVMDGPSSVAFTAAEAP